MKKVKAVHIMTTGTEEQIVSMLVLQWQEIVEVQWVLPQERFSEHFSSVSWRIP